MDPLDGAALMPISRWRRIRMALYTAPWLALVKMLLVAALVFIGTIIVLHLMAEGRL